MRWQEKHSKLNPTQAIRSRIMSQRSPAVRLVSRVMTEIGGHLKLCQGFSLMLVVGLIIGLVFLGPLGTWSPTSPPATSDVAAGSGNTDPAPDDAVTIDASLDDHGSTSPSGTVTVGNGSDQALVIADVPVNGSSVGAAGSQTPTSVIGNHTMATSSTPDTSYTITATADAHGSISPSGTVTVTYGSNQSFAIVLNAHYCIRDVLVDGSSVGAMDGYAFTNITENHTIAAYTTPTLVVAARNSSHPEGADYVCDGVSDEVQINAAIAKLPAGGVVQLLDGTFTIGANGYVRLTSNVTVKGKGPALTTVSKVASSGSYRVFYADSGYGPYTKIGLVDMKINLGSQSSYVDAFWGDHIDGLLFNNVQVLSSSRKGLIYIQHSKHMQISGCLFDGVRIQISGGTKANSADAIDSDDALVQGCTFKNTPTDEFALGNTCKHWRILNNTFLNCPFTAIDTANSPDALISGNVIDGACLSHSWDGAIYSEGGIRVTITNNRINNCPISAGISVSYMIWGYGHGGDILIDNNTVTNTRFGIASLGIPRVTISNNQISHTSWHGVLIEKKTVNGVTYYPNDCKVTNNRISDFGKTLTYSSGVQLNDCQRCQVSLNVIDGNNNANAVYGVRESGKTDYSTINNNILSRVRYSVGIVGRHTVVKDNV